jgi:uncharacterized protein
MRLRRRARISAPSFAPTVNQIHCNSGINGEHSLRIHLMWLQDVGKCRFMFRFPLRWRSGPVSPVGIKPLQEGPSFECSKARLPDEITICRTPELAEFDNVIAAGYAFLKSTRGRAYADQVGIPFWRLRQACQYDPGCIRQAQIQAINAYQAAGAPISVPQHPLTGAFEAATPQDPSAELRLCRNSSAAADKIAHCSNVIANFNNASALVVARNTRGLALMDVGRYCDAVGDFTFVIEREPRIAGYLDNRQNALRQCGRLDDALRDANGAIRLAPTYSFVFRGRANVYDAMWASTISR